MKRDFQGMYSAEHKLLDFIQKVFYWGLRLIFFFIFIFGLYTILKPYVLAGYGEDWTGFGEYFAPNGNYNRYKTLWDWIDLLFAPIIIASTVAIINLWFRRFEQEANKERMILAEKFQHDMEMAEWNAQIQFDIQAEQARENSFREFLDQLTNLLLDKQLNITDNNNALDVINAKTLSLIQTIDIPRKARLLLFLYDLKLIKREPSINLTKADLSGIDLGNSTLEDINLAHCNLKNIDFSNTNLIGANFEDANLAGANFTNSNLFDTNLSGCNLLGAYLENAKVDKKQLERVSSLFLAIMPDGEFYNNEFGLLRDIELEKNIGKEWGYLFDKFQNALNPVLQPYGFIFSDEDPDEKFEKLREYTKLCVYKKGKSKVRIQFDIIQRILAISYSVKGKSISHINLVKYTGFYGEANLGFAEDRRFYLTKIGGDPIMALANDVEKFIITIILNPSLFERIYYEINKEEEGRWQKKIAGYNIRHR